MCPPGRVSNQGTGFRQAADGYPGDMDSTRKDTTRTVNRTVGFVFGGLFVLTGLAGFGVTDGLPFMAREGEPLLAFEVNPLHNLVHLGIGLVLIFSAIAGLRAAKRANTFVGAVYLLTGLLGLFLTNQPDANILAINAADNGLHFVSALVLLGVGLFADRGAGETTTVSDAAVRSPRARQRA